MFLAAGASKLSDLGEFADAIKLYKIIPGATAGAVAKMVAVTEVVLGTVLLIVGWASRTPRWSGRPCWWFLPWPWQSTSSEGG